MPQLGAVARFGQEVRDYLFRVELAARKPHTEPPLRQMGGEHARIVSIALDSSRVAQDAVLLHALSALVDGAGEVNAWHCRALPERSLSRQPALAERGDAQLREVAQRRGETGRGDHVVDLKGEDRVVLGAAGSHLVAT